MPQTTSNADIEIDRAAIGGTGWLGLMLARPRATDGSLISGAEPSLMEALSASDADSPLAEWLEPIVEEDFSEGVGLSYNVAPGAYTRTPGYVCPAGLSTDVTIPSVGNSNTAILEIRKYGVHTFFAQHGDAATANTARVLISASGVGALSVSHSYATPIQVRDMIVFAYDGTPRLYVSWSDGTGGGLSVWDGASWTHTASGDFGSNGRFRLFKVFWVHDGIGGNVMGAKSATGKVSYTRPDTDPMVAANWIEGVPIGTGGEIQSFATARQHVYVACTDGLFDLDGFGNSPNLTAYGEDVFDTHNGAASVYFDGYVYWTLGQGLDRVYVGEGPILQEAPGICSPGWGTPAEQPYRGWADRLCVEQGYIVAGMTNPTTNRCGIFWGIDRTKVGIESRNPLIWYGPEVFSESMFGLTAMRPISTGTDLRLWLASTGSGSAPTLSWVSLPRAGAPLDDMISGGPHRFALGSGVGRWNPTSSIESLLTLGTAADSNSDKIVDKNAIASRGLGSGVGDPSILFFSRADPTPGQTTWGNSVEIEESPSASHVPAFTTRGKRLQWMAQLISPNGGATPPSLSVLLAVRRTVWRTAPTFPVATITAEYGDGVLDLNGHPLNDATEPDTIKVQLQQMTETGRLTMRDRQDRRWTIKLRQVLDSEETLTEGDQQGHYGKRVTTRLQAAILAGPLV